MTLYRILAIVSFLAIIGGVSFSLRTRASVWSGFWEWVGQQWDDALSTITNFRNLNFSDTIHVLQKLLYIITLLCVIGMILSGFLPVIFAGANLGGFLLVIHATISPIFAVSIALLVLISAHSHRFNDQDWATLNTLFSKDTSRTVSRAQFGQKVCYWLLVVFSIPVITSILFSMYPIFGTEGQENLLQLHRYSTLLFVIIASLYSYLMVIAHRTQDEELS